MITVTVASVRGSAPREVGAAMEVRADGIKGTIGGGRLEWEAIAHARTMMTKGVSEDSRTFPLGPDLGQCCGGVVELAFRAGTRSPSEQPELWIWGAGHVGRAVAHVMAPLEWNVTVIDTSAERFNDPLPEGCLPLVAADPVRVVPKAPADACHLIVTYRHDIDLNLCAALLGHPFAWSGLIGSDTKWARFKKRLRSAGLDPDGITCPIGDPSLGKAPAAIAVGVAAQLIRVGSTLRVASAKG